MKQIIHAPQTFLLQYDTYEQLNLKDRKLENY